MMRWHVFNFRLPVALRSYPAIWPLAKVQASPRVHLIEKGTASSVRPLIKSPMPRHPPSAHRETLPFCSNWIFNSLCDVFATANRRPYSGFPCVATGPVCARPIKNANEGPDSHDVNTPFTIGFGVVLPSSFDNWDPAKLQMVLAHERSHILQADFFLQLLARLYAAFFWFSPAAWWLQNKLVDLGEATSDHAAITQAPDRCSYAALLLEFAAVSSRPLAGIAMARSKGLIVASIAY